MIRFENLQTGQLGTLDVARYLEERAPGTKITGVKDGIVQTKGPNGERGGFSLAQWAENNMANVVFMEGFNNPDTAIDQPPLGMNYFDQAVFFQDGMDMAALSEMFPRAMKDQDGTVKVLDSDGLWKIMWSPYLRAPEAPPTFEEEVGMGLAQNPGLTVRTAGVHLLYGICGKTPDDSGKGGVSIRSLVEVLRIIQRNAPLENRAVLGQLMHQTTGLDPWKFSTACLAPEEVGHWLKAATTTTSFQYRYLQAEVASKVVEGLRIMARDEFDKYTEPLIKMPETESLLVNMKQVFGEFVQMLVGLNLLRDISRSTGLQEWISLNEENGFDPSRMPEMPDFVEHFVKLLRMVLPIVKETQLNMARGKKGLRSIFLIMKVIDDCLFSLVGVPDHSAKYKMFMALKKVQTGLENKLSFHYQPDPLKNKDGLKENMFMQARKLYAEKREMVYELCQTPRESWNNTLLVGLRGAPNLEQEFDKLPKAYRELMKSFVAMDAAYDMQPWVDVDHQTRTHDAFSQENPSFGARPPETGYLAKNSPRAVFTIAETLIEGGAFLSELPDGNVKETLRNPQLLNYMLKMLMKAAVHREVGTAEILNSMGVHDMYASPDPGRIFEDPEKVEHEQRRQIQEMMGQMAEQQAMQNQQKQQQAQQQQAMMQQAQQEQGPEKASKGPQRAPAPQARGAA